MGDSSLVCSILGLLPEPAGLSLVRLKYDRAKDSARLRLFLPDLKIFLATRWVLIFISTELATLIWLVALLAELREKGVVFGEGV